jgi:biotin carboxyl carrier protein
MSLSRLQGVDYHVEGFEVYNEEELLASDFKILHHEGDTLKVSLNGTSYLALIKHFEISTKTATINVNGLDFKIKIKDELDRLMDDMGLLKTSKTSTKEIKSPMPGLVVMTYVVAGQAIVAGDKLLSLEAMKMENIIKANADGIIKSVLVSKGNAVEKNQILIELE